MPIERPRSPELSAESIRSHVQDAINEVNEYSRIQTEVFNQWARLNERSKLIRMAIVKTAVQIIESLPIDWEETLLPHVDKKGSTKLEVNHGSLVFLGPAHRLLVILTSGEVLSNIEPIQLTVQRLKPQKIRKEDRSECDYHQMDLNMIYGVSQVNLRMKWDEDEKYPDSIIEFSYNTGVRLVTHALRRTQMISQDDEWRKLEDASGFITILENSTPVSSQSESVT